VSIMAWFYEIRNSNNTLLKRMAVSPRKTPQKLQNAQTPRKSRTPVKQVGQVSEPLW